MKQFAEFLPIVLFVIVYFTTKDIFLSTAVLMGGMTLQVIYEYITTRTIRKQTLFIFLSVVVLGGLTLTFRDEAFIQWKPTVVNMVFCIVLLGSQYIGKENLFKKMLGKQMDLPEVVWRNLAFGWSFGFFVAAVLNLVVAFNFNMDIWVTYKLVGGFGLTLIYMVITIAYLYMGGFLEEPDSKSDPADV